MISVQLVGILNITPDSFSGDGVVDVEQALIRAEALFAEGASLLDIGAEATNPWAKPITIDEEWQRLESIVVPLIAKYPDKISVDTHHPEVIEKLVKACGKRFIVNDVTGMNDPLMQSAVVRHGLQCIVSHLPREFGTDIEQAHKHANMDSSKEVLNELLKTRDTLVQAGLDTHKIILDPGIGFGKTMRLNQELLQFAALAKNSGVANEIMIGYSHKRFLGEHRFEIEPNLAATDIAITAGAKYLRVHDVSAHHAFLEQRSAQTTA